MADLRRNIGIPSGVVFPFAGTTAPYGYLICDGRAISRSDYADLFMMIGTSHGIGNGSTTFNLPDYRGRFLRGVDGLAGNDPDSASRSAMASGGNTGNNVGSVQGDSMQGHWHAHSSSGNQNSNDGGFGTPNYTPRSGGENNSPIAAIISDGSNGTPRTSSETRGKNVNVNFIIKI
jgi:microcystin-dependent protein